MLSHFQCYKTVGINRKTVCFSQPKKNLPAPFDQLRNSPDRHSSEQILDELFKHLRFLYTDFPLLLSWTQKLVSSRGRSISISKLALQTASESLFSSYGLHQTEKWVICPVQKETDPTPTPFQVDIQTTQRDLD